MKGYASMDRALPVRKRKYGLLIRSGAALLLFLIGWGLLALGGVARSRTLQGLDYLLNSRVELSGVTSAIAGLVERNIKRPVALPQQTRAELPVTGDLSRSFGWQRGSGGWPVFNTGIDLKVEPGATVRAALGGKVTSVAEQSSGKVVIIGHDGDQATLYAPLRELTVQEGERVGGGAALGRAGGDYLHLEWRQGDRLIDPLTELPGLK